MTIRANHWDTVYGGKPDTEVSWFEPTPALSLELIARHAPPRAGVIDIGGGASRLVAALARAGHAPLAVLDVSAKALNLNRTQMGPDGDAVRWIAADITGWQPDGAWPVWHDRAVFHFLTDADDQAAYVARLTAALAPGGTLILATFAADGPEKCSGLPVQRYSPQTLAARLDALAPGRFQPIAAQPHLHRTQAGKTQRFQYSVFRHKA